MSRYFALLLLMVILPAWSNTLVHNVRGYTMDDGRRVDFVALEFDKGFVTRLYHTTDELVQSSAARRIDARGATMLPGLIDAHGHIAALGEGLGLVDLVGCDSEEDAVARARNYAAQANLPRSDYWPIILSC